MKLEDRPRIRLGFPWEQREDGNWACRLRVPGYRYDEREGYHAAVFVSFKDGFWKVGVNGSVRSDKYDTLNEAIGAAEMELVEAVAYRRRAALAKVREWDGLFETLGMHLPVDDPAAQ